MDDVIVTVQHAGDRSSALIHQMRNVGVSSEKRSVDLPSGPWFDGSSSERLMWSRWLWTAAPLRADPPSDNRATMVSGEGNTRTTCRLWQTPVSDMTSLSANTQRGTNCLYLHMWSNVNTPKHFFSFFWREKQLDHSSWQRPLQACVTITHTRLCFLHFQCQFASFLFLETFLWLYSFSSSEVPTMYLHKQTDVPATEVTCKEHKPSALCSCWSQPQARNSESKHAHLKTDTVLDDSCMTTKSSPLTLRASSRSTWSNSTGKVESTGLHIRSETEKSILKTFFLKSCEYEQTEYVALSSSLTSILHGRPVHEQFVSQQLLVQSQQVDAAQAVQKSVWKETEGEKGLVTDLHCQQTISSTFKFGIFSYVSDIQYTCKTFQGQTKTTFMEYFVK